MNEIQKKAILLKVNITLPGLRRGDKDTTNEIVREKGMGKDAGKWHKHLYPEGAYHKPEGLKKDAPPTNAWVWQSQFRTGIEDMTLAWPDPGIRLLPMTKHDALAEFVRGQVTVFDQMRDLFVANLAEYEAWARKEHNGTFDPKFYRREVVEPKFKLKVEFRPIPSDDQFSEGITAMVGSVNADECVAAALKEANKDLFTRLAAPVKKLAETLKDSNKKFKDSLVGNILDVANEVQSLNVTNDPGLMLICDQMVNRLAARPAQTLRQRFGARAQVAADADAILEKMKGYV